MVEKENFDKVGIVLVNDLHANIDHMFGSEGRLWSDAIICARGDREENANIDKSLAVGRDKLIL